MTYYEIEDDVPIPPNNRRKYRQAEILLPGQSIVVPSHKEAQAVIYVLRTRGYGVTQRKLQDGSGIRVWCLAKEEK